MDAVDLGTLIVGDYVQQAETLPQTSSPLEAVRALSDAQPACLLVVNKAGGLAGEHSDFSHSEENLACHHHCPSSSEAASDCV